MGALLVSWTIPLAIELPFSMIQDSPPSLMQNIVFYAAEFLIGLISYVLSAGLTRIHLHMARGQEYTLKMIFSGFKEQPDRYLLTGIFRFLATLAGMLPFLAGLAAGLIFHTLPVYVLLGIFSVISLLLTVFFLLNIALTLYLVIDHPELSVWNCLKNSVQAMRGHKGRLLYIWLSFLGLQLLCLLSFGLGSLWVVPYQSQTLVNFYLDITGQLPAFGSVSYQHA
ncbi:MAG: DUF975 family protein [Blautia sp.]|nr:DUF975 family protein [Blautia sp.]